MSQYPYEQSQPSYPQSYPQDQPPYQGYPQQPYPPAQQPAYGQQQPMPQPVYYAPPPPVQVNVVQNAGLPASGKRINHGLHIALSFFTGGLWLFVYIPMVRYRRRHTVYLR